MQHSQFEVFGDGDFSGPTVTVLRAHEDPGARGQRIATSLGASMTVFVLPPRRDDCAWRLRMFTPNRELPLSTKGAFAAAASLGLDEVVFEQGVIAVGVRRDGDRYAMTVTRPVINGRPVEDRALAASAFGLDVSDLADGLPVQSASCGWLTVQVPVRDADALARAAIHPGPWQRMIEKAKPVGAVLFVPTAEGPVRARVLVPRASDDAGSGLALASTAVWLVRFGVRPAGPAQGFSFEQGGARVEVTVEGDASRDDAVTVYGRCRRVGDGAFA